MTHRYRLALCLVIAVIIAVGMLVCRWWPSHVPLAHAASFTQPTARWTPVGVFVAWQSEGATRFTVERCRAGACLLLGLSKTAGWQDCYAANGDVYRIGAFAGDDPIGWQQTQPLRGGLVWLPLARR